MTTIAFDGRTLAVDKASWQSDYVWSPVTKLFSVVPSKECRKRFRLDENARLKWAASGDASAAPLILDWMYEGGETPPLDTTNITTHGFILNIDNSEIYRLTSRLTLEPLVKGVPVADGGGFQIALGAMLAGASAVEAIEIVASRSGWAAGGIDSYTLPGGLVAPGYV